jgi:hypothetical protein
MVIQIEKKKLEEKPITRRTYIHAQPYFTLGKSIGSSSSSTKEVVGIISEVIALVAHIIGCNIALKTASSTSNATTC